MWVWVWMWVCMYVLRKWVGRCLRNKDTGINVLDLVELKTVSGDVIMYTVY
jgi:hypothetical protein